MKLLKTILAFLAAAAILGFVTCENNPDPEDNGGNGNRGYTGNRYKDVNC